MYLLSAQALKERLITDRRQLHRYAEVGTELPSTTAYVMGRLQEMGYEPKEICPSGITATLGKPGGKTILLRADMDALPMQEESGLDFASQNTDAAHTCGHDLHTAMLLGVAKLLKDNEAELEGQVRLMFQPDEEGMNGARLMIEAGILEDVDAGLALHVAPGPYPPGLVLTAPGVVAASQDRFVIKINGKGCHGAMPHMGVDPISVGSHIVLALQELIARELNASNPVVVTVGVFKAGDAANIIPQAAELQGTLRALSTEARELAKTRLVELCEMTARTYRADCVVEFPVDTPCTVNDPDLTSELSSYVSAMGLQVAKMPAIMGSEDFAYVSERIPCTFLGIAAGGQEPGYHFPQHNPKVCFNEDALPIGAAILAECAQAYLKTHSPSSQI